MRRDIFNIQRILFLVLFCGVSLVCYSDNSVIVGLFRLTPCLDNPSEYCISMNKDTVLDTGYETLCVPSKIQEKGKIYKIVQIAAKGFTNCCFIKDLVIEEGIKSVRV